jgi:hypothetical protein
MLQLLDIGVHNFFPEHKVDEDFINLFVKAGFEMIENQNIVKNLDIKLTIFKILQKCIQMYGGEMEFLLN